MKDETQTAVKATTDSETAVVPTEKLNLSSTINRLEYRANTARRSATRYFSLFLVCVVAFFIYVFYELSSIRQSAGYETYLMDMRSVSAPETRVGIESPLVRRIIHATDLLIGPKIIPGAFEPVKFTSPTETERKVLQAELKDALADLEKGVQIADAGKQSSNALDTTIQTVVFSLGLFAILVLSIHNFINFLSYYSRLAELYSSQADALRASDNNPELACALLEQLSPNMIEIGKAPSTLYEKAFDAIREVASGKRAGKVS